MMIRVKTPKEIGLAIRTVRKAQGLRQDDLAGMLGVTHVFLGDAERGKETAQIGKVLRVLEELGIHLMLELPDTATPANGTPKVGRG